MFEKIPAELRKLPQWVCFDITEDGRKIPYIPGSDSQAASNRPTEWRSFRAACEDVKAGKRQHLGFAFAPHNNLVFIDLDDLTDPDQPEVLERINTYAQRSVSGRGVHLICRGTFRGAGKHPKKPHDAGIFKEGRFCLMTGDVLPERDEIKEIPEGDLQAIHNWLGGDMNRLNTMELVEYKATIPDLTVYEMCRDFSSKFEELCAGRWEQFPEYNGDHSAADHALISTLCDFTDCNEQVRWLFKVSGMWTAERQAKKAGHGENGYIDRTIKKIRARQGKDYERSRLVQLDFSRPLVEAQDITEPIPEDRGSDALIEALPDGLVKDLARHSFQTSFLPLQEASLLVGLGALSGIVGRGFLTPTGMGLNLWVVLVGTTGCGKDEFQSGMQRIFNVLGTKTPAALNILGGEIASGPGLETVFTDTKRFISYVPEFDRFYKNTANPNGQPHQVSLQQALLNSFNLAKVGGALRVRRRAQAGDTARLIDRPCLCLVGEATPDALFASMTTNDISSGLLPRFMLLEVAPESYSLRPNTKQGSAMLPVDVLERLERLSLAMDKADVLNSYKLVRQSKTAGRQLQEIDYQKRLLIRTMREGDNTQELHNRTGLKVYRLASLLAVAEDFDSPRIDTHHVEWALNFVETLDHKLIQRFSKGKIGSGQVRQEDDILQACAMISHSSRASRIKQGMTERCADDRSALPLNILKDTVVNRPSFSNDKTGAVTAFHRCLENLIKAGKLVRLSRDAACDDYGHRVGEMLYITCEV